MVFRGGADHGRAADVDIFDHLVIVSATGERGLKRVEIDDQEINCADAMGCHGVNVGLVVAQGEQAAVDHRVKRLDAAVHHLREACDLGDIFYIKARVAQGFGAAACGKKLDTACCEGCGQLNEARFVGDGEKRAVERGESGRCHGAAVLTRVRIRRAGHRGWLWHCHAPWPATSGCAWHTPLRGQIERLVSSHVA